MDADESRMWTMALAMFSLASQTAFVVLYLPLGVADGVGASIRPATITSLTITVLAMGGWIPVLILGCKQLLSKPRKYGMLTISIACVHAGMFQLLSWWLIDSRGHHWGT